jgi:hypothetical protein
MFTSARPFPPLSVQCSLNDLLSTRSLIWNTKNNLQKRGIVLAKNPDAKEHRMTIAQRSKPARFLKNNRIVNESHIAIVQLVIRARNNVFKTPIPTMQERQSRARESFYRTPSNATCFQPAKESR